MGPSGSPLLVMPGLLGRDAELAAEEASHNHEVYVQIHQEFAVPRLQKSG